MAHAVTPPQSLRVGKYKIVIQTREVLCDEVRIGLTWRCFEALLLLIERRGEVAEREEFLNRLWPGITVEESNLTIVLRSFARHSASPRKAGSSKRFLAVGIGYRSRLSQSRKYEPSRSPLPTQTEPGRRIIPGISRLHVAGGPDWRSYHYFWGVLC